MREADYILEPGFSKDDWPLITEETTLEEVRKIHKRIWNYVIEHGEKPETPYRHNCVLCEYISLRPQMLYNCSACPAIWDGSNCESKGSEYVKWKYCSGKEKEYWAKKVRDIPFQKT